MGGPNTSLTDIRQALTQIGAKSPEAVQDIRQRTLRDIVENSRAKAPLGRQTTGEVEDLSHEKLLEYTRTNRPRYEAVLGKDGMAFLDDLATYAEGTAKRQAAESGRQVSGETLAKEVASGAAGFTRNAIGATVDAAGATARVLGGGAAVRNPTVRNFITTGELPVIGKAIEKLPGSRVLAVPSSIEAVQELSKETPPAEPPKKSAMTDAIDEEDLPTLNPRQAKKAPVGTRFVGTNGLAYEKLANGKIEQIG